jgi:hypothetical protein
MTDKMDREIRSLTRGQKLTDAIIDYFAEEFIRIMGGGKTHYIPTYMWRIGEIDWTRAGRICLILNQDDHWFLLVRENKIFHLYDSIEKGYVDMDDLPIPQDSILMDYYDKIPDQGESRTNCGMHALLNLACILKGDVPLYDPRRINQIVRPFFKTCIIKNRLDIEKLFSIII